MVYLGIMAYKYYFITWSWRSVYVMTTILNGFFSALQILLITGETFGLSPFLFALGDDVLADFISGIQFLVRAEHTHSWDILEFQSPTFLLPNIPSPPQSW
jgi:hypothetical protein